MSYPLRTDVPILYIEKLTSKWIKYPSFNFLTHRLNVIKHHVGFINLNSGINQHKTMKRSFFL